MSQKPSSPPPVRSRVASGIPWWLWGTMILVGGGIVLNLASRAVPESPEEIFASALAAAEKMEPEAIVAAQEKLKAYPEYADQLKLLDGIMYLGRSRPVKAIKPLEEASANPKLRERALQYLGTSFAQAENPKRAVETFELLLKEFPDSLNARDSLAQMLTQQFALEEAAQQLSGLIDKKFRLAKTYQQRGEIRMDLGQVKDGVEDLAASIKEATNDPTNAQKAARIVESLLKSNDVEGATKHEQYVDRPTLRNLVKAYNQFGKDDLAGALATIETIRIEAPNDEGAAILYGKVMLRYNKPEKAKEALVNLNKVLVYSRNAELYRVALEVAQAAGDSELGGLIQQNLDQLETLDKEYREVLAQVAKTRDDIDGRLRLAALATDLGYMEMAMKLYQAVKSLSVDKAGEVDRRIEAMFQPRGQLVKTGEATPLPGPPGTKGGILGMPPGAPGTPEAAANPVTTPGGDPPK